MRSVIARFFPALPPLVDSFDQFARVRIHAVSGEEVHEWNPLSQRPYWPRKATATFRENPAPGDFSAGAGDVPYAEYERILLWLDEVGHELMHVALWEPFFGGKANPLETVESFTEWSHYAEGFCFWYGDIAIYRKLWKTRFRDADLGGRSVGFGNLFNPGALLDRLGYRTSRSQLEILLRVFSLDAEMARRHAEDPKWIALLDRAYKFVLRSNEVCRRLHEVMRLTGISTEFFQRFCSAPELPTLYPDAPTDFSGAGLFRHFASLAGRVDRRIAECSPREIAAVRERRWRQGRAYFLFQLRFALRAGLVVDRSGRALAPPQSLPRCERLLDRLEVVGKKPTASVRLALAADIDGLIRSLARAGACVGSRELILPSASWEGLTRVGVSSFLRRGEKKSIAERLTIERALLRELAPDDLRIFAGQGSDKAFDRILLSPLQRSRWSVDLAEFDFDSGDVRELLFQLI